jgi:hypothetical protein
MKKEKRKIKKILLYGKPPKLTSLNGLHHGDKVDLDGILNVQQWHIKFLDTKWIFILEVLT